MAVRDKYLRSINLVNDLNASILEESAEVECENISIEDDLFQNEGVTTAQNITSLLSEWQQLDADYLVDFNRVNGTGKRTGLAVPYSFDLSQVNSGGLNFEGMEHERIPPHLKNEYLTKLTKLFRNVPQEQKSGGVSVPLNSADNTEKFLVHDLHLIPELRPPFERYTQTVKAEPTEALQPAPHGEAHQEVVTNNEVVISVTVFGADHRLTQPQQCIEILGSQTLWQLQQAIYCVHNTIDGGDSGISSSSNIAEEIHIHSRRDKDSFFCIDGQIYAQLCRPTASGTTQEHQSSCTCNNTITSNTSDNNNSSGSTSSAEATAHLNTGNGNDYIPGTEPVRALIWLYRSLFGITLPGTIEDTTNNSTNNNSEQNNVSSSTILTTGQHPSVTNSSNAREDVEQIIFINTNEPPPAAAKSRRGRPAKNTTISATDSIQPTSTSAGSIVITSAASADVTQAKTKGKKRCSNNVNVDPATTTSTSAASTVPKGRKKAATASSSQATVSAHHISTSSSSDITAKAENDNLARLQHPYDFHALRAAVTSSTAAIEIKCVHNMRLADMNFTLGVPYLYTHACGCEHIVYFTNIRAYSHKYDHIGPTIETQHTGNSTKTQTPTNAISNGYPLETFRARHKQKRCTVCEVLPAVCVVLEDRLAETNPTLYCEHCYHMLHYSAEGHLLYDDFQVFPYIHDPGSCRKCVGTNITGESGKTRWRFDFSFQFDRRMTHNSFQTCEIKTMIEGYIFAQKVDEGFPGGHIVGGKVVVATGDIVFVQANSLEEALQYLMNNTKKLKCMQGAFTGLRELAKYSKSIDELKKKIDESWVNGDSEAKVIYGDVYLPELPLAGSDYFLRFLYSVEDLEFWGVGDLKTDQAVYEEPSAFERKRGHYRADLQLDEELVLNVPI